MDNVDSLDSLTALMIGKKTGKTRIWRSVGYLAFDFGGHALYKDEPFGFFETGICVEWRIENAESVLIGSKDDDLKKNAGDYIEDKQILNVSIAPISLDISIDFENDVRLRLFTVQKATRGNASCWTLGIFDKILVYALVAGKWKVAPKAPRYANHDQ